jgi:hypothetical protein
MDEKLKQYAEKFGEGFPMMPLAWGKTEKQVIELIDQCLSANKNAYELGLVQDDDDIEY